MKSFYSFIIFGVLFAVCLAQQGDEFVAKIFSECKEPTGATDDDVKGLLGHQVPTTQTGKCLLSCAQDKLGVTVNGKVSADGVKAIGAKKYEGNEKDIATFNEIAAECSSITDPDPCEQAAKLMECLINGSVKRGIDPRLGAQN